MAYPQRPEGSTRWSHSHQVQFKLPEATHAELMARARDEGLSPNIAAKMLVVKELDPTTYARLLTQRQDPTRKRLEDPSKASDAHRPR